MNSLPNPVKIRSEVGTEDMAKQIDKLSVSELRDLVAKGTAAQAKLNRMHCDLVLNDELAKGNIIRINPDAKSRKGVPAWRFRHFKKFALKSANRKRFIEYFYSTGTWAIIAKSKSGKYYSNQWFHWNNAANRWQVVFYGLSEQFYGPLNVDLLLINIYDNGHHHKKIELK